mgnify:CR=1 FL=1
MAITNRDRVARVMDLLKEGLGPFVLREYKMVYKDSDYVRAIDDALRSAAYELPRDIVLRPDNVEQALLEHVDAHGWLKLMWAGWNDVFRQKLGFAERSYVSELMEARNDWAHQRAFTNDDAYRVADTASRLLGSISAGEQMAEAQEIGQELLRLRFEAESKKSKKDTGPLEEGVPRPATKPGLKPWRHVVQPHPDVASGHYMQAEFTADLSQVLSGRASSEYQDPREFFRRTYLTEGLLTLLTNGIRRMTSQGGDPVVQLQTAFGGGKTHSMLALYHLAGGEIKKLSDIVGGERIAQEIGDIDPPEANRAVLVGQALNPADPRVYPDCTTRTLWGEMAYQLGGVEGYQMVANADLAGVNPGSDTLVELLQRFGPCLIIIDELVAYARNLYRTENLPAGSFDTVMSFTQSLTEAVRRRPYRVILFDEIEKAHPEVWNALMQILEDGRMTDGQGRTVDFRNSVIIMTSNLGTQFARKGGALGFVPDGDPQLLADHKAIEEAMRKTFRPEFLNRIDEIIIFEPLTIEHVTQIVDLQMKEIAGRLAEQELFVSLTEDARLKLANLGYNPEFGARPLRRVLQRYVESPLSVQLLRGEFKRGDMVQVFVNDQGEIDFQLVEGEPLPRSVEADVEADVEAADAE